ncbi:MAG TPA: hypothetical protein VFB08_11800 [Burkholderiales bacterium]|nr:hypothetical protein [Burkholderiales bacterium]
MKILIASCIAAAALSGCAVVPVEPAPGYYAAPPPAVVVQPYAYYGYYGGYGRWHRHWR